MSHISGSLRGQPLLTGSQLEKKKREEALGVGEEGEEEEDVIKSFDLLLSARSTVKNQRVCVIL